MSYDLFFRSRSPSFHLSKEDFLSYFQARPRYETNDLQAVYSNESTGVYFVFDYDDPGEDGEAQQTLESPLLPVTFNLNYFRPHPFGMEAEPELAAFVKQFNLTVSDPQNSGMGDGQYSAEGFLRGWNAGNAFAYLAMLTQDSASQVYTLPAARIEAAWRWNFNRLMRQDEMADSGFVPGIFFFDVGGDLLTAVIWGDGIPILLPQVDLVLVPRKRLSPQQWYPSRQNDLVMFTWPELEPLVRQFPHAWYEIGSYQLFYHSTPPDIEQLIRRKQPPKEMPKGMPFDQVLDRELIEQAKKQRGASP
jgi:hypothetical protein